MSLPPRKRTQTDGLSDEYSVAGGLSFDPATDLTRQEFKQDADINVMVRRQGIRPLVEFPVGARDYDMDLIRGYERAAELRASILELPPEVLEVNGGVDGIIQGVLSGRLQKLELPTPPEKPVGGSGGDSSPPGGAA